MRPKPWRAALAAAAGATELIRSTIEERRGHPQRSTERGLSGGRMACARRRPRPGDPSVRTKSGALSLGGFVTLLLAGLASHFVAKSLAGPVRSLMTAAGRVAEGNYRVTVESASRDELGRLAESFNEMTGGTASQGAVPGGPGQRWSPRMSPRSSSKEASSWGVRSAISRFSSPTFVASPHLRRECARGGHHPDQRLHGEDERGGRGRGGWSTSTWADELMAVLVPRVPRR